MVKKKYSDTGEIPEMEETADVVEDLESAPIADEPKEEASPVEAPKVVKPSIALRVFLQICGKKADQTAGFSSYAKRMGMGPRPVEEWREAYQDFMNRPVG